MRPFLTLLRGLKAALVARLLEALNSEGNEQSATTTDETATANNKRKPDEEVARTEVEGNNKRMKKATGYVACAHHRVSCSG